MTTFEKLFGDKFSKFRLGQLLFITAVTFGLFTGDIIRIVFGVFALFCLTKENFKFTPWTKEQKITGWLLALFCAWMIIIPIIFGENPLDVRLRDAVRPIELTLWIVVTFLFAKDEFFVRNLKNFSITACFCYAVIALVWCVKTKFSLEYDNWPIIKSTYSLGALMAGLSAWIIYQYLTVKKLLPKIFCSIILLCAMVLVILSFVVTHWSAFFAELTVIFIMLLLLDRKKFLVLLATFILILTVAAFGICIAMQHNDHLKNTISQQIDQIMLHKDTGFDVQHFTNNRYKIWNDAVAAISKKPAFGYGAEVFERHSSLRVEGTYPPHAHNCFLEAAFECGIPMAIICILLWLTIFLLACYKLFRATELLTMPFVTVAVMTEFVTAGFVENMFLTNRCQLVFYWSVFITMIAIYDKLIVSSRSTVVTPQSSTHGDKQ